MREQFETLPPTSRNSIVKCLLFAVILLTIVSIFVFQPLLVHSSNDAARECSGRFPFPPPAARFDFNARTELDNEENRYNNFLILFDSYAKFHSCMVQYQSSRSQSLSDLPLLVLNLHNGIGNRMRGLASGLVAALLTKRILVVIWWPSVTCEACNWRSVLEPPPIEHLLMFDPNNGGTFQEPFAVTLARWSDAFTRWYHGHDITTNLPSFSVADVLSSSRGIIYWNTYDFIVPALLAWARDNLYPDHALTDVDARKMIDLLDPEDVSTMAASHMFFYHMSRWLTVPVEAAVAQAASFIDDVFIKTGLHEKNPATFFCTVGVHMRFHGQISGAALDRWRQEHPYRKGFAPDAWTQVARQWKKARSQDSVSYCHGVGLRFVAACDLCEWGTRDAITNEGISPAHWVPGNDNDTERARVGGEVRGFAAMLILNALPTLIGTTNSTMSWVAGHAGWRRSVISRTGLANRISVSDMNAPEEITKLAQNDHECQMERIVSCYSHDKGY